MSNHKDTPIHWGNTAFGLLAGLGVAFMALLIGLTVFLSLVPDGPAEGAHKNNEASP